MDLKQRLTNIEDKMLETSIVIRGISEEKWEDPVPRRQKLNHELANTLHGETYDEKIEKGERITNCFNRKAGKIYPNQRQTHLCEIHPKRGCRPCTEQQEETLKRHLCGPEIQ